MKRTRRVSLTIEHREISISHNVGDSRGADFGSSQGDPSPTRSACTVCGAPWIPVDLQGTDLAAASTEQIFAELLQRGLHPLVFSGGRLWMCRQSLQDVRDSLL
jgi:hypothetical protein